MKYLDEQKLYASGAVNRSEFEPTRVRADMDPPTRARMESVVWSGTPGRHRFKTAAGERGIVFFDERGRAASGVLSEIGDGELARLYDRLQAKVKPTTSATDHGYRQPTQE